MRYRREGEYGPMLSVFLDANVIYSITLTDVLLTLAEHDLFSPVVA